MSFMSTETVYEVKESQGQETFENQDKDSQHRTQGTFGDSSVSPPIRYHFGYYVYQYHLMQLTSIILELVRLKFIVGFFVV